MHLLGPIKDYLPNGKKLSTVDLTITWQKSSH